MKRMFVCALLLSCGGGTGAVSFTTWGEAYIEDQIPTDSAQTPGFVDGWSLKYSKFLVVFKELHVADRAGTEVFALPGAVAFDLTKTGPVVVTTTGQLPSQRYDKVSYAIGPDVEVQAGSSDLATDDLTFLRNNTYSVYVEATATKDSKQKRIKWGFSTDTLYFNCENNDFGGSGVNVATGTAENVQLTVHGDHFYYDDLQSDEAKLRFEPIANADTSGDGTVTLEELDAVQLTSLPITEYGTGGAADVKTLKGFVTELSRTLGHYRGEGECERKAR